MCRYYAKESKLGLLGGYSGEIHAGPDMGRHTRGGRGYTDPTVGAKLMYVSWMSMGPFVVRSKQHFLNMGGLDYGYSCRGDPGIGFDWEFSLRNWVKGYAVAIFEMGNTRQQGEANSGTRTNTAAYKQRLVNLRGNTRKLDNDYKRWYDNNRRENPRLIHRKPSEIKPVHRWATLKNAANAAKAG